MALSVLKAVSVSSIDRKNMQSLKESQNIKINTRFLRLSEPKTILWKKS